MMTDSLEIEAIQLAWILLLLTAPTLCWMVGRSVGIGGRRTLLMVGLSFALGLAAVSNRGDEPLHANGHAWREAREVLLPIGTRSTALAPYMHGKGGIALQWLAASAEHATIGSADPFRGSRLAAAAAAAAAALLALVLVDSAWAALAAGCAVALMPLGRMVAVSGSVLVIPEWMLAWSLALLLAAARSGSRLVLAGAVLAAVLGTLSHTAMLAWPAALALAWIVAARRDVRWSWAALNAVLIVVAAWLIEAANAFDMVTSRNEGEGLLAAAWRGMQGRNLFLDPSWVSPILAVLIGLWIVANLKGPRRGLMIASVAATAIASIPFFAVTTCSSDAVRYQGALLALGASLAIAGLWCVSLPEWIGGAGAALVRIAAMAVLIALPLPEMQQPPDPAVVEHRLVEDAVQRMEPGTLVVIPRGRYLDGRVLTEFPDFLLPAGSAVLTEGDARIDTYPGPRLLYLGLACISWDRTNQESDAAPTGMRPECLALRDGATPWMVRSLRAEEIPRERHDRPWTFHALALDAPFGFFALPPANPAS